MRSVWIVSLVGMMSLTGCSFFRYGLYKKAEWAPPDVASRVKFPNSYEQGAHLDGPLVVALEAAVNDFLPPGSGPRNSEDPVSRCLSLRETFHVSIYQPGDNNIFFVRFTPDLSRCAPGAIIADGGAEYAVDAEGRILARQ